MSSILLGQKVLFKAAYVKMISRCRRDVKTQKPLNLPKFNKKSFQINFDSVRK